MKIVCYIYRVWQIGEISRGKRRPVKFFRRQDVNAIQRGVVYILRNAYEIALCSTYRKNAEMAAAKSLSRRAWNLARGHDYAPQFVS